MNKLVLGTVQFGCNYGINNAAGQVPYSEVCKLLKTAYSNDIRVLDTSSGYGESEIVLGRAMKETNSSFKIVSKLPPTDKTVYDVFSMSINNLGVNNLYGYMVHHFDFWEQKPKIYDEIIALKEDGKIQKIGFSIYNLEQLFQLWDKNIPIDIIQFPYNIFDRQFEPYFTELQECGVEIHTRSVFLQGLFFKDINSFPEKLKPLKSYVEKLQQYCATNNINIAELVVGYSMGKKAIDGVLMGVDNCSQFHSNILCSKYIPSEQDNDFIESLNIKEKELLNPVNWN